MKRIFFLIIILLASTKLQAQIEIVDTFANEIFYLGNISANSTLNTIAAISGGRYTHANEHKLYCRIYRDSLTIGLWLCPFNEFADIMEISLGRDFESVNKSLDTIIQWIGQTSEGASLVFRDQDGRIVQINHEWGNGFRFKILEDISFKVTLESGYMQMQYLLNAKKLLNEQNDKKIREEIEKHNLKTHPYLLSEFFSPAYDELKELTKDKDKAYQELDKQKKLLKQLKKEIKRTEGQQKDSLTNEIQKCNDIIETLGKSLYGQQYY